MIDRHHVLLLLAACSCMSTSHAESIENKKDSLGDFPDWCVVGGTDTLVDVVAQQRKPYKDLGAF